MANLQAKVGLWNTLSHHINLYRAGRYHDPDAILKESLSPRQWNVDTYSDPCIEIRFCYRLFIQIDARKEKLSLAKTELKQAKKEAKTKSSQEPKLQP